MVMGRPKLALELNSQEREQLESLPASQGQGVARQQTALAHALHPDRQILAQSGGTLLCVDHGQGHPARLLRLGQGTRRQDRSLHVTPQQVLPAVSVDSHRRLHTGKTAQTLLTYQRDGTLKFTYTKKV